jgi:transcriptional regulator with XRE-family HTH domain
MANTEKNITTITSICVILLRELRTEKNIHQAQIADWIGKTPSAWTKVESGKSPLQFETFIRVCNSMQVTPSTVMAAAERYAAFLSQNGWGILTSELSLEEKDSLMVSAQEYWGSLKNHQNHSENNWGYISVLSGPIYNRDGSSTIATVVKFALDPVFREEQLGLKVT